MLPQRHKWVTHLTVYILYKIYSYSLCNALSIVNLRIVLNDISTPLNIQSSPEGYRHFLLYMWQSSKDTSESNYEGYSTSQILIQISFS